MSDLPRRTLGRTGFDVAALGLGAGWIGEAPDAAPEERDALAVAAIRRAVELSLNYVDTSPSYRGGASERRVGLALRDGWRDRVRLATKAGTHPARPGDYSAAAVTWSVEQSLRVLGTDVIDVLLIHDPEDMAPVLAPDGALAALERLKAQGTIRAIGLGVQNHLFLRLALETGRFDVIQVPYDFSLLRTSAAPLIALARERNVGFLNASPFQQGLLAGPDPDDVLRLRAQWSASSVRRADVTRAQALYAWARARGANLRALAVQFCLREPGIAATLVGPRTTAEVDEDVAAALAPIPAADWEALSALLPILPAAAGGGEIAVGSLPPLD